MVLGWIGIQSHQRALLNINTQLIRLLTRKDRIVVVR